MLVLQKNALKNTANLQEKHENVNLCEKKCSLLPPRARKKPVFYRIFL